MGLDYSYDIICKREQLWDVLQRATELSDEDFRQDEVRVVLRDREITVPFAELWGSELVFDAAPIERLAFSISMFFEKDEPITKYIAEWQPPSDEQERIAIGYIHVSVSPVDAFKASESRPDQPLEASDVRVAFSAATTDMSILFEESTSILETFLKLARSQDDVICILNREGRDIGLWLEDREILEEVGSSWATRAEIKKRVRANQIGRTIRRRVEEVRPSKVFAEAMSDSDPQVRAVAIGLLGDESYTNVELLEHTLAQDINTEVRCCAAEALGAFGYGRGQSALINALTASDADVRYAACHSLRRSSSDSTVAKALIPLLKDEEQKVRRAAAVALEKAANETMIPALVEALQDQSIFTTIATALGRLHALEAVEPLCALLKRDEDEGYFATRNITDALVSIGDHRAVPALIRLLQKGSCMGRHAAASALGLLGDQRAIEPLTIALQDSDYSTRERAEWSLNRLKALYDITQETVPKQEIPNSITI